MIAKSAARWVLMLVSWFGAGLAGGEEPHPLKVWVKRHPGVAQGGKPSPRLGYETSYGYDLRTGLLIRYGGHNQGGGGEQNSEVWIYDLDRDAWELREPNDAPPGVCCAQQNVFEQAQGKFLRFPAFSGSHGWQSFREIHLKNSSVWSYDPRTNTWRELRPFPDERISPLRGAAYDPGHEVTVVHGGEGARHATLLYDLGANRWHALNPPPPAPGSTSQPGFAFDEVNGVFVLFGSQFDSDPRTWIYRVRENRWEVLDVDRHPPADKSSPVLAADTRSGIVLCSVCGPDGIETWTLDTARREWTRLENPGGPAACGSRNRVLLYLPDRNLFVLENRDESLREQQIWTLRLADAPAPLGGPGRLKLVTFADDALLSWDPPEGVKPASYELQSAEGAHSWEAEFRTVAEGIEERSFRDEGLRRGEIRVYRVRATLEDGRRSRWSNLAWTRPGIVSDLRVSAVSARRVEVRWAPAAGEDIAGYHVERAKAEVDSAGEVLRIRSRAASASSKAAGRVRAMGPFTRCTQEPLPVSSRDLGDPGGEIVFVDANVDLDADAKQVEGAIFSSPLRDDQRHPDGQPYAWAVYAYRVVAVNRLGVESGPSPYRFTFPAAVEHLFAREEPEGKTRLRWGASPQRAIRGYLVYRQDGRWDTDPIRLLTPDPITGLEFLDETAGEATRRYEVTAVDALGQEGEPSRPVWSRREWRRYYVPYTGAWHQ